MFQTLLFIFVYLPIGLLFLTSLIIIIVGSASWFRKGIDYKKGKKVILMGIILMIFAAVTFGIIMFLILQVYSTSIMSGYY